MNTTVAILPTQSPPAQCVYSDAMNYLGVVKSKRPEVYPILCVKLIDYLSGRGEPFEIIRYAAVTFRDDPDLSSGFRKFLPPDDTIFSSMLKVVAWETVKDTRDLDPSTCHLEPLIEKRPTSNYKVRKLKFKCKLQFKNDQLKSNKENGKKAKFGSSKFGATKAKARSPSAKASKSQAGKDVTNTKVFTPKKVRNSTMDHAEMYKTRNAIFSPKKVSLLPRKCKHGSTKSDTSSLNLYPFALKFLPESNNVSNGEKFLKENIIPEAVCPSNFACNFKVSWKPMKTVDLPVKSESQSTISCASIYPGSTQKSPKEDQYIILPFDLLCYQYNNLVESLENVKNHFKKRGDIYKMFVNYLDDYQKEIRENPMNDDVLMRSMLDIQLHQRICDLFENEMDILPNLDRFIRYVGAVSGKVSDIDKLLG